MANEAQNACGNNAQNLGGNDAENQGGDNRDVQNVMPANNAQNQGGDNRDEQNLAADNTQNRGGDDAQNLLLANNGQNPAPTNLIDVHNVLANNAVNNAQIQLPQMNLALNQQAAYVALNQAPQGNCVPQPNMDDWRNLLRALLRNNLQLPEFSGADHEDPENFIRECEGAFNAINTENHKPRKRALAFFSSKGISSRVGYSPTSRNNKSLRYLSSHCARRQKNYSARRRSKRLEMWW